uniref:Uncharacterized protein n=1 Tax=Anguilla anguilla TaxID=7936 RepID=A0A0E9S874_ANGAN
MPLLLRGGPIEYFFFFKPIDTIYLRIVHVN